MATTDVLLERLPSKVFKAKKNVKYVDVFQLLPLYEKMRFEANMILVGPKGVGKSLSFHHFANQESVPIVTADCSEDMRRSQLVGGYILRGEDTPFVLGPVTTAFEVANEEGSCVLLLEEINALTPQAQKLLNPLADFRKRLEVPEAGKVFRLKKGCKLWIVGTMNTSAYGGVYSLNEDLKSRFRILPLSYPMLDDEKVIITETIDPDLLSELPSNILDKLLILCNETRQGALEYALSTRDLVQLVEDSARLGVEQALQISTGKFEDSDRDTYIARIRSILGVTFDEI